MKAKTPLSQHPLINPIYNDSDVGYMDPEWFEENITTDVEIEK